MIYTDLIYDFDGTIADSYPIFTESFLCLIKEKYGITADYDEVMGHLKVSVSAASKAFGIVGDEAKAFHEVFRDHRDDLMLEKGRPMDGAEEILRFVIEHGGRNYIYTHSPNYIWEFLEKWDLRKYFVGGVTADFGFPAKPAPNGLNYICEHYALNKSKTLMIGDRSIDVDAGKNAGVKGVLLDPDGFYRGYSADYTVTHLTQISAFLTEN